MDRRARPWRRTSPGDSALGGGAGGRPSPRAVPGPAPYAACSRRRLKGTCGWPRRPAAALRAPSRRLPMRQRLRCDASRHRATIRAYGLLALSRVRGSARGVDTDRAPTGGECRRMPQRPAAAGDRLLDLPWHGSPGVQRLARRRSRRSAGGTCTPRGRFGGWPGECDVTIPPPRPTNGRQGGLVGPPPPPAPVGRESSAGGGGGGPRVLAPRRRNVLSFRRELASTLPAVVSVWGSGRRIELEAVAGAAARARPAATTGWRSEAVRGPAPAASGPPRM